MMLVRDPQEKFGSTESNDGGTKFNQRSPETPEEAQKDPWFNNGKVLSADFGPSKLRPSFSYFSADLTAPYSPKLKSFTRSFCFLNLNREDIPAAIILNDNMTAANPEFKKYLQLNTHKMPEMTGNGIIIQNECKGLVGKTHVEMLVPS
jgi:heparin/heparan-sulfate lyase